MKRERYDVYIARFNAADSQAFDEFLAHDVVVQNGALTLSGRKAMADHYERSIWPHFEETLTVLRYVSDQETLAVQLWTRFLAQRAADTPFGEVEVGEVFDYRGVVLYEIDASERFSRITVAYNSFINIKPSGAVRDLGMPH